MAVKKMELVSANYVEVQALAAADLVAGTPIAVGDLWGFPLITVLDTVTYSSIVQAEKVRVVKVAGEAWVAGDSVTWDAADANFNLDDTANPIFGTVYAAAASADVVGYIVFDGHAAHLKA